MLERILERLPDEADYRRLGLEFRPSRLERLFLPLARLLAMLKETVEVPGWEQNQLAVRILGWIAEMYKIEVIMRSAK